MANNTELLMPPGRLVAGSLYKGSDKDAEGNPLVIKSGPNAGQPRVDFYFGLAVPKGAETHWSQTPWGAKIWAAGHSRIAHASQIPTFAWKITDGDSTVPNRAGKKPADRDGYARCWVLNFSSGYAPKSYKLDTNGAPVLWPEPDAIKPGDWIEVYGSVGDNGSAQQPGVFLNHSTVCFAGFGDRIVLGVDVASIGFGKAALPPGVSAAPLASGVPMPAPAAVPGYVPPAYVAPVPQVAGGVPYAGVPVPAAPIVVQPHPAILAVPVPVPVPVARQMTAAAGGNSYEGMLAQGWTDALLVQHGMMIG